MFVRENTSRARSTARETKITLGNQWLEWQARYSQIPSSKIIAGRLKREIRRHCFPRFQLRPRRLPRDFEARRSTGRFYLAPRHRPERLRRGDHSRWFFVWRLFTGRSARSLFAGNEFCQEICEFRALR